MVPGTERPRFTARKFGNRFFEQREIDRLREVSGKACVATANEIFFHAKSAHRNRAQRG